MPHPPITRLPTLRRPLRSRLAALGVGSLAAAAAPAAAQPAAGGACPAHATPFFEFQVDQPAVYAGDSTLTPRPAPPRLAADRRADPQALVVQFVVDTLGRPEEGSFRVLSAPSPQAVDAVRTVLANWRYEPAVNLGCRVPQLVQTAVERVP